MSQGPPPSDAGPSRAGTPQVNPQATSGNSQTYSFSQFQTNSPWPYYQPGQPHQQQYPPTLQQIPHPQQVQQPAPAPDVKPKSPSPPPPPKFNREWDAIIKSFLERAGLKQTLRAFEKDMVVLNPDFEEKEIPSALAQLHQELTRLQSESHDDSKPTKRPLEEKKLDYIHPSNRHEPRTPTSINKEIAVFLARNRARNDASNRREFLKSLSEKRRRLLGDGPHTHDQLEQVASCARTDAKTIDRDLQMKYDIAKNEEGPLRKTIKTEEAASNGELRQTTGTNSHAVDQLTPERYPGLDERIKNIETHLSVRYVPAIPHSFLDRIRFLEDHIIRLEKEYPPWAALHFNQPHRGVSRSPIGSIVHGRVIIHQNVVAPTTSAHTDYRAFTPDKEGRDASASSFVRSGGQPISCSGEGEGESLCDSSLLKAVMEKLEVQKAKDDLARGGEGSGT
ncbi:hypothetical protein GLOTRDRAFT_115159 [Gloeophyllum trabeum ATCC 11539]|uniref:Uncharacterized protein n=1 Tax=Gloeophyllum trabeum (strain ATCC 11539 / FP-39264 / Madison 617) TaxID=670483 RepID=S7QCI1_GLOTA|nr:uncharacterized protein GLOTRDRAFT_115159 [Gloeophyllum trabeum ATCC 11539]EPQ57093.1 hypothetical protein GLOTRDRAFT_115159 [Gloeophyllum trabeum ATCC 11539]